MSPIHPPLLRISYHDADDGDGDHDDEDENDDDDDDDDEHVTFHPPPSSHIRPTKRCYNGYDNSQKVPSLWSW